MRTLKKNLIPLKIADDFVFETILGINLPLDEVFLEPIAENHTHILKDYSRVYLYFPVIICFS
jgi:hypothetical protein